MKAQQSKCRTLMHQRLRLFLIGLTLLGATSAALADDLIVNTFDTGLRGIDWQNFRGYIYWLQRSLGWVAGRFRESKQRLHVPHLELAIGFRSQLELSDGKTCRLPSGRRRSPTLTT